MIPKVNALITGALSSSLCFLFVNVGAPPSFAAEAESPTAPTDFKGLIEKGENEAKKGAWQSAAEAFFKACSTEEKNYLGYYDLGIAYLHLNKLPKARAAEERALDLSPNNVNTYIQLASVLSRMGAYREAEDRLKQALAMEPNNETAKRNLDAVYSARNGNAVIQAIDAIASSTKESKGDVKIEKRDVPKIAIIPPPPPLPIPQPAFPIGRGAGEFPLEYEELPPPASRAPISPLSKYGVPAKNLSDARDAFERGKVDLARRLLEATLAVEPKNLDAVASLGVVLGCKGELDEEVVLERKALAVSQSDGIAHLNLAWALARQGKWKDALHEYDQATVYEPRIAECWVGLGLAQMHNQMPTLAEKTLSDACQKFPQVALPHVALSQLLATTGQFGAAQQELQKAIDTQPESADALERVAAQELNAENWDKAADIYSDVIRKFPQESQAWLGLALALEKTQFKQKSLDCFRRAAALSPKDSLVHMALALAYEERGRIPEAEMELQEALRLNPDYRVAASQLKQQSHP